MPAVKIVNFSLNYLIEQIPTPDKNVIYSLNTAEKNILDKPKWQKDDAGIFYERHELKNYMTQNGGQIYLVVSGAPDSQYKLQVYNETDDTYYSWDGFYEIKTDRKSGGTFSSAKKGAFQNGNTSFMGKIQENGKQNVLVKIPPVNQETIYKVRFVLFARGEGNVNYLENLPINGIQEHPDYIITQLPNPTTTIQIDGDTSFNSTSGDLVINHQPGANLSLNKTTGGVYDVSLQVTSRNDIQLLSQITGGKVLTYHMEHNQDEWTTTEILDTNLTASVGTSESNDLGTGYITGTITIGKTGLRNSIISIKANEIFTQNANIILNSNFICNLSK